MHPIKPPESKILFLSIHDALVANPTAPGIHISIESHARAIKEAREVSYMKALCWNLTIGGEDLPKLDPVLVLVEEEVNEFTLREDADRYFKTIDCVIDNDIWIEEDET